VAEMKGYLPSETPAMPSEPPKVMTPGGQGQVEAQGQAGAVQGQEVKGEKMEPKAGGSAMPERHDEPDDLKDFFSELNKRFFQNLFT